jgi:hypothetical protein
MAIFLAETCRRSRVLYSINNYLLCLTVHTCQQYSKHNGMDNINTNTIEGRAVSVNCTLKVGTHL